MLASGNEGCRWPGVVSMRSSPPASVGTAKIAELLQMRIFPDALKYIPVNLT